MTQAARWSPAGDLADLCPGSLASDAHVSAAWLSLREPADGAARAADLVERLREHLAGRPGNAGHPGDARHPGDGRHPGAHHPGDARHPGDGRCPGGSRLAVHDLGSGTGSMLRWLAPQLPLPQRWYVYDRDPTLLALATSNHVRAGDGGRLSVVARRRDITRLSSADLDGAGLVTTSAVLDMLTADEIERVVAACAGAGCPVLATISVIGRVDLTPADPLDAAIAEAFNAHQRRTVEGRTPLGPWAVDAAAEAFRRRGMRVLVSDSPWRLGAGEADLAAEWFGGWVGAACEQRPELTGRVAAYTERRVAQAAAGRLGMVVHHVDLLATWA